MQVKRRARMAPSFSEGGSCCRRSALCARRRGLTVLELLTVAATIGVLTALILPAVCSARDAAQRLQCVNHLKQLGLALHNYHSQFRCLPAGWQWEGTRRSAYAWAVPLLPYLDLQPLYQTIDRPRRLDDPSHTRAREATLDVFLCPSDIVEPHFTLFEPGPQPGTQRPLTELPTANYLGVFGTIEADDSIPAPPGDGTFLESRCVRFAEIRRGLSNTLFVGERTMARVPSTWLGIDARGEDAACRLVGSAITRPNCPECDECEFDSRHPGGSAFLWGDGRVSLVSESIDSRVYRWLARRSE
ncbi:MAG: DUF1559 domain-containing protein [Planctomycetes bacterium]|nr:DUF1559 domain-containing protein [Planctomycetota bacterium]